MSNITVLDMTHVLAGPFCTYQMALLGADVVKIESPHNPDCARGRGPDAAANAQGLGLNYQTQGGNKRALALDISQPDGREALLSLVAQADVLVENYTTDAMARLKLDYGTLAQINPTLIYCSISGYGDSGPDAATGAYDNVIQAASGTIAQCGGEKPSVSFIDYSTGYAAAFAVSSALVQRVQTGKGCHISVSMLEVAMQMMSPEVAAVQHLVKSPRSKEAGITTYDTADGQLTLGVFHPAQYRKLSVLLAKLGHEIPELAMIQTWEDVWALPDATKASLVDVMLSRSCAEWVRDLRATDLPAEPVTSLAEAVENTQLAARGYFQPNPDGSPETLPVAAFHMTQGGPALTSGPPKIGQHSKDVLRAAGLDDSQIAALVAKGVVV
ncbi:CoA transferase [Yoonia sp. GPGPB17]|uniref:CaiB/BaiF CoA transferase family protein n=1 Tax=Yoonia sp. GPGPB17 TaxID=3026147 RepID=UPI0030BC2620